MTALAQPIEQLTLITIPQPPDPTRHLCPYCDQPTLHTIVSGRDIIADIQEWEPRAACGSCLHTRRAHPHLGHVNCARCADTGYIGSKRPPGWMLAIDMAWGDDLHTRVLGPRTDRRQGEALYQLHICRLADLRRIA